MTSRQEDRVVPAIAPATVRRPLKVFISYAHEDDGHRLNLVKHFALPERQGLIESWHDRLIPPGANWANEIDARIDAADLVLLLVSADFFASNYCWGVEMTRALERHAAGAARVIPIIVDHCVWSPAPFRALQALPTPLKPVTAWPSAAEAWTSVAQAILALADGPIAPPPDGAERLDSPTRYLTWLNEQHSSLEIRGMGAQVAERMELSRVYTRLTVSAPERDVDAIGKGRKGPAGEPAHLRAEARELRDLLAGHPHAALVGDPGSGKTTFLRFVVQNLARAHLGDARALDRIGLEGALPFPIFARLEEVASFLGKHPHDSIADDAPEHFYRFLDHTLAGHPHGLEHDYLRRRIQVGGCMLLLDGLDEVPGEAMRLRIVRLIENVVAHGKAVGNRHLITCRTRAYQGRAQLAADVSTLRLAPFERSQVEQFAESWSRALFRVDSDAGPADSRARGAMVYRDDLLRAIAQNPNGATFTQSPLMLTVLAVVHWDRKELPEQRAELYLAAVEYLLKSRPAPAHSKHPMQLRRECLQAVAMRMFDDPAGVRRTLGRREAANAVRGVLRCTEEEATEFLEHEELHSGLLVSRTDGEVEFWHLTFQEYLAALELSPLGDVRWGKLRSHLHDDRWSEVVLLLAGCERRMGLDEAERMINRILDTGADTLARPRAVGLVGRVLQSLGISGGPSVRRDTVARARAGALVGRILRDIRPYGGDAAHGTPYARLLKETLSIFEPGGELLPEDVRREVGEALGQAGDPRLPDAEANKVRIPGGVFWMGAQNKDRNARGYDEEAFADETPVHQVAVSALSIGRFPVTVAEFHRFVEAGERGYLDRRHWDSKGWAWREGLERTRPSSWDTQVGHRNRPVTGVSWYEADAYCRFVGGRLPTEAEWEWVARGKSGRKFPWGNEPPTPNHASFGARFNGPATVGIYPRDVHEQGVRDLAGNVWEWCSDWSGTYDGTSATDPTGPSTGPFRVLRGGSFNDDAQNLRAAFRISHRPEIVYRLVGFRVVWSLAGGQL